MNWSIRFCGFLLALVIATSSRGQLLNAEPEKQSASKPAPSVEVVQRELTPAAEPKPALKYRLRKADSQLRDGDMMQGVLRAILMRRMPNEKELQKQYAENHAAWNEEALTDENKQKIRAYLDTYQSVLAEIHDAAEYRSIAFDSRFSRLSGIAVYAMRLDEMQELRELSRLLVLEARLAISNGDVEDALRSIRSNIRVAEAASMRTSTLIGKLVGIAIAGQSLELVRELSTLPGAPNLYWAIATFPKDSFDMQPAYEAEMDAMRRFLGPLPASDEQIDASAWRRRLKEVVEAFQLSGFADRMQSNTDNAQINAGLLMVAADGPARNFLTAQGIDPSRMTPSEAILRALEWELVQTRDAYFKWTLLPEPLRTNRLKELTTVPAETLLTSSQFFPPAQALTNLLFPSIVSADNANARLHRSLALLATVEAIRMYAAETRKFPATLDELKHVPAWSDPVSGKPFNYQRLDDRAAEILQDATRQSPASKLSLQIRSMGNKSESETVR